MDPQAAMRAAVAVPGVPYVSALGAVTVTVPCDAFWSVTGKLALAPESS